MTTALVIVDVQRDFCEGGSLPVEGGSQVAKNVSAYLGANRGRYALVIATRDWHVDPGNHFSEDPDYQSSWPRHCVAGTEGAAFHPDLDLERVDVIVSKGATQAAYSGFEARSEDGRTLGELLDAAGVDCIDVAGLATDYCVRATALDARQAGLDVRLLVGLCAGVAPHTTDAALGELQDAGVSVEPS